MIANRYTFDTNIYFYSLDETTGAKHLRARNLIRDAGADRSVIMLQVLGELSSAISKRRPHLLSTAERLVNKVSSFAIPSHPDDLNRALVAHRQHHLPFWDAMLWAIADRSDCDILFTEDFQHGRVLGSVTVINPFILSPEELAALLA